MPLCPGQEGDHPFKLEGDEMMAAQRYEDAVRLYSSLLDLQPSEVRVWGNRAQAYLYLGRFEEAERDATMVLGIDPDNIKAHYRRGWARLKLRTPNVKGGKEDLARVLSQEPGNKAARDLLQNFEERGPDEDAGVALTVVEDDSEDGCSWCPVSTMPGRDEDERASLDFWRKGEQFKSNEKWHDALGCFNRAAVANPLNSKNWVSIAEVHREQGNHRESEEASRRAACIALNQRQD
ncbi:unnamed protein product [Ectocarpus sp. 12 AP-2014]